MTLYRIVRRIDLYATVLVTRFPGELSACWRRIERLRSRHPENCYETVAVVESEEKHVKLKARAVSEYRVVAQRRVSSKAKKRTNEYEGH